MLKNDCLLSVVSDICENLAIDRLVVHLEKCDFFSVFQLGYRKTCLVADLLTVVTDRNVRAFNRSGATQIDITKAFEKVLCAFHLHKLKSFYCSIRLLICLSIGTLLMQIYR